MSGQAGGWMQSERVLEGTDGGMDEQENELANNLPCE